MNNYAITNRPLPIPVICLDTLKQNRPFATGDEGGSSMSFNASYWTTGIGSVPFISVDGACENIVENFPDIPFCPPLPLPRKAEDM